MNGAAGGGFGGERRRGRADGRVKERKFQLSVSRR